MLEQGEHEITDDPINRATVNQLSVDQLDQFLNDIRLRRLEKVKKLETVAKVKADDAELTVYLKFERAFKQAQKLVDKLAEEEAKAQTLVNKCRALALEMADV